MSYRKLLIIWKWWHLKSLNLNYRLEPVEDTQQCVFSIQEDFLDKNSNNWFQNFCSLELSEADEIIILFHSNHEERRANFKNLCSAISNANLNNIIYFGGGNDYIYYNKDEATETGLLDQVAGFQDDHFHNEGHCSVLRDGKIINQFFNDVWDYYSLNKYKEPIYTFLREKLLLEMFAEDFKGPIRSWLDLQPDDAKSRINEFVLGNHPVFQKNKAESNARQGLLEARQDLIQLLDKPLPNALEIRKVTETLLTNIAGPIY